jgi:hypothetical protein
MPDESLVGHKMVTSLMSDATSTGLSPARLSIEDVNQLMDPFFFRRLYI